LSWGLGRNVLWRLWRDRIHFHAHSHLMGLARGMAASAAVLVLAVGQNGEPVMGLAYNIVFDVGSTAGVAMVSLAIGAATPLAG